MEKKIKALLDDRLLRESAETFGFCQDGLTDLHGFQNFVYEANRNGESCILRIAHCSHRSLAQTEAELDWIEYLVHHGVKAAAPIRSAEGLRAVKISRGDDDFVVAAFAKAPGAKPHYQVYMENKQLIRNLGRITGKMHALSKKYKPASGSERRQDWKDNHYLRKFAEYAPSPYAHVIEKTGEFLNGLSVLPRDDDSYGLIHGDIHLNNIHVCEDDLILFDFDECEYSWFAADIANPLFYATPLESDGIEPRNRIASRFFECFMEGYSQENSLEADWLKKLPLFLRLREILVLSGAFRSLDLRNLHPWSKEMIESTVFRLENDVPFLDIRFA